MNPDKFPSGDPGVATVQIIKKPDDPLGINRISAGGIAERGLYYCVYRGSLSQTIRCVRAVLASLEKARDRLVDEDKEPK